LRNQNLSKTVPTTKETAAPKIDHNFNMEPTMEIASPQKRKAQPAKHFKPKQKDYAKQSV
jgi:hypothetical protein